MTRNIGGLDKGLRLGLGLFGPIGWWGAVALVPLATGLVGNCPLYSLLGFNTCPVPQRG